MFEARVVNSDALLRNFYNAIGTSGSDDKDIVFCSNSEVKQDGVGKAQERYKNGRIAGFQIHEGFRYGLGHDGKVRNDKTWAAFKAVLEQITNADVDELFRMAGVSSRFNARHSLRVSDMKKVIDVLDSGRVGVSDMTKPVNVLNSDEVKQQVVEPGELVIFSGGVSDINSRIIELKNINPKAEKSFIENEEAEKILKTRKTVIDTINSTINNIKNYKKNVKCDDEIFRDDAERKYLADEFNKIFGIDSRESGNWYIKDPMLGNIKNVNDESILPGAVRLSREFVLDKTLSKSDIQKLILNILNDLSLRARSNMNNNELVFDIDINKHLGMAKKGWGTDSYIGDVIPEKLTFKPYDKLENVDKAINKVCEEKKEVVNDFLADVADAFGIEQENSEVKKTSMFY